MYKYLLLIISTILLVNVALSCESHMNPNYATPKIIPVPLTVVTGDELTYHETNMQSLIDYALAQKAVFAASIYHKNGTFIHQDINKGRIMGDPTQHAEIVTMQYASANFGISYFSDYILYTTGESCLMCQAGLMWNGFSKVIYGTSIQHLYCNKCMGQIPIDSGFVAAYGFGLTDNFVPMVIIGGILKDQTDNVVFKKDYCPANVTSIFKVNPLCVDPNDLNSSSGANSTGISLVFGITLTIYMILLSILLN